MNEYVKRLERLEQSAYQGGWGADWLEEVGENVKFYAIACEQRGELPTFRGLVNHLEALRQAAQDEANSRKGKP